MSKKKPRHITFTGVDERTDIDRLADISSRYPCEWGILYSRNRQGLDNRYPSPDAKIFNVLSDLKADGHHFAAHICGKFAQIIMRGDFELKDRLDIPLGFHAYDRIQVNHIAPHPNMLDQFAAYHGKEVICQYRGVEFPDMASPSLLYDPSGGNGLMPTSWPRNPYTNFVGYAGGLNASNIHDINATVSELTVGDYWLDMETGVRTNDYLDLDKVEAVLREVYG